ncbi:MBL fold metallo-hydrolase [Paenarthrobacter sp. Z7-10]|uniref:MBL fold metallo-hydrolase n=1 Tax=Paenarthrobacter sp. Z7-10 TaxID=2787635 RepID=UPI0022A8FEC9|nr:MBL fold metallo-hydrolase [Paenarthrobacter sp. Z7-10]MCZ2402436.1 MBL fold metallo-hydrolase [Paenarthrobacter sp. Z7-10]
MKLTKFTHACIRLEKVGRVLVLDPGVFSETGEALRGADAILVTHEHADHFDADAISASLSADPALLVYAPAGVAASLRGKAPDAADRVLDAEPDTSFDVAGFGIRSFGGQHALIHPHIPVVANIGFLVEENVYHPGDSFIVPDGIAVQTLLVPIHAPWSKTAEVIDFVTSVRAPVAFQIHDGLLNENGLGFAESHVQRIGARYGTEFRHLAAGESVEV